MESKKQTVNANGIGIGVKAANAVLIETGAAVAELPTKLEAGMSFVVAGKVATVATETRFVTEAFCRYTLEADGIDAKDGDNVIYYDSPTAKRVILSLESLPVVEALSIDNAKRLGLRAVSTGERSNGGGQHVKSLSSLSRENVNAYALAYARKLAKASKKARAAVDEFNRVAAETAAKLGAETEAASLEMPCMTARALVEEIAKALNAKVDEKEAETAAKAAKQVAGVANTIAAKRAALVAMFGADAAGIGAFHAEIV